MSENSINPLDLLLFQVKAGIREDGWYVVSVAGDRKRIAFAYTVGLWATYQHPEIIVLALPQEVTTDILLTLSQRVKAGERFALEKPYTQIVQTHPVMFRSVPGDCKGYLKVANQLFAGKENYEAIQLFWTDNQSRFPWQPGYSLNPNIQTMRADS